MKGYKGLTVRNGTLRGTHNCLFEIGVTNREEIRDEANTDFQDCYYHFCDSFEGVLTWRNYFIIPPSRVWKDNRLFEIEAGGHWLQNGIHDWVTNEITVIREVSQKEIIDYFNSNPYVRDQFIQNHKYDKDMFDKYASTKIEPYELWTDKTQIITDYVKQCPWYRNEICLQDDTYDMNICERCRAYNFLGATGKYKHDYYYALARCNVLNGGRLEDSLYYNLLVKDGMKQEIEVLKALQENLK